MTDEEVVDGDMAGNATEVDFDGDLELDDDFEDDNEADLHFDQHENID